MDDGAESSALADLFEALARYFAAHDRRLAQIVAAELRGADPRLIDQACSPLGRNKHIAAVKRRHSEAEARGVSPLTLGASRLGRRYLLTQEACAEEQGNQSQQFLSKARQRRATRAQGGVEDSDPAFLRALERARSARRASSR